MAEYTGNFETGTNGNNIQTTDAGSLNAWDDRNFSADATLTYSNVEKYGNLSARMVFSATPNTAYVAWTNTTLGSSLTELWGRVYLFYAAWPATTGFWIRAFDGGSRAWESYIDSTGKLVLRDSGGTQRAISTNAINAGAWVRIEFHVQNSSTAGFIEAKLFNDPDSATATETVTSTGSFSTLTKTDLIRIGENTGGNPSNTVYMDNILVNTTGYPGPLSTPSQTLLASADSVDGAWTDQAGGTSLAAAIDETTADNADYIRSELSPSSSGCRVKLASGGDPASSSDHVIKWRVGKNAAAGQTINMTVKLYQGGGNSQGAGTLIASFNRNGVTDTITEYSETLSGTEADTISDYSDLYLEFFANAT